MPNSDIDSDSSLILGIATSLGLGIASEATKRLAFGSGGGKNYNSHCFHQYIYPKSTKIYHFLFIYIYIAESTASSRSSIVMTPGNVDRVVDGLTRMRGAALKLGQMLSIQGNHSKALFIQ